MKQKMMRIMRKVIMMLAVAIAPVASGYCRTVFYEEKKPEGVDIIIHKGKSNDLM